MTAVQVAVQVGFCVLVSVAALVAAFVVWRDDHSKATDGGWI